MTQVVVAILFSRRRPLSVVVASWGNKYPGTWDHTTAVCDVTTVVVVIVVVAVCSRTAVCLMYRTQETFEMRCSK